MDPNPAVSTARPDVPEWRPLLRRLLGARGLRLTPQRAAIAEVFFEMGGHANVEELYRRVRRRRRGIGQATVYRMLKLLTELGLAEARDFGDGRMRYEPALDDRHHDHLICTECGRIVEFEDDAIERLQEEVARAHGFELVWHKMELYGRCEACRKRADGDGAPNR